MAKVYLIAIFWALLAAALMFINDFKEFIVLREAQYLVNL